MEVSVLLFNARLLCKNNRRGSRRKGGVPTPLDIIGLMGGGGKWWWQRRGIYKILSWMDVGPLGGHCNVQELVVPVLLFHNKKRLLFHTDCA